LFLSIIRLFLFKKELKIKENKINLFELKTDEGEKTERGERGD